MWPLLLSIGLGAAVAVGWAAAWSDPEIATSLGCGSALMSTVCAFAGVLLTGRQLWHPRREGGGHRWCLALALLGLMVLRGVDAASTHRQAQWRAAQRGPAVGLRELEIVSASVSGPRCEALAAEPATAQHVWLSMPSDRCPLAAGQRIRVGAGALTWLWAPRLPGAADPRRAAIARGASLVAYADEAWSARAPRSSYWQWVAAARERAWQWTRGDDAHGFVVAATLGAKTALAPARKAELRAAGLGHLIAVSGLHVALAAWIVHFACLRAAALLGRAPWVGVLASWVPLWAYVGLTGGSAPAVRAATMLGMAGLGAAVGRPSHGMPLLALAAAGMLFARPGWAVDPGFQLSLVAMLVLVRAPARAGIVSHSWRIAWAILPLGALYFGQASAWSVIGNLVAIPVFTVWVLPAGLIGWALTPWVGPVALEPAAAGATIVLDVARWLDALPQLSVRWAAAVAAGLGLARLWPRSRRPPWFDRVVPPLLACAGAVAAALWVAQRPVHGPGSWMAVGSVRDPAVVAVVAQPDGSHTACVRGAGPAPHSWLRLLRAVGIDRVASVEPGPRDGGAQAPHLIALREALADADRFEGDPAACVFPQPARVEASVATCARQAASRRILVIGADEPTAARCWVAGRFVPLATLAKEDADGG